MWTMIRGGLLGLFVLAFVPGDALAAVGWLEKLSGPGPFVGWQVNVPFACYGFQDAPWPAASEGRASIDQTAPAAGGDQRQLRVNYDCLMASADNWSIKFAVDVGRLSSTENELPYPGVDDRLKPNVNALVLMPSASLSFGRFTDDMGSVIDVGVGVGAVRFSDDGNFFDAFWKPAFQPVRVAIRPLALFRKGVRWEFLEIGLNATIIGGEMTAADFGAAGSFQESNELVWNRAIRVDLFKLFQPPRRTR